MRQNSFSQLVVIQAALIVGVVIVTVVMLVLHFAQTISVSVDDKFSAYFLLASILFTFIAIIGGKVVFTNLLIKIIAKENLEQKMKGYLTAVIIRFSFAEAAVIFSAAALLLTGSLYFLVMIAIVFFFLIIERPTRDKVAMELNLSPEERLEI